MFFSLVYIEFSPIDFPGKTGLAGAEPLGAYCVGVHFAIHNLLGDRESKQ